MLLAGLSPILNDISWVKFFDFMIPFPMFLPYPFPILFSPLPVPLADLFAMSLPVTASVGSTLLGMGGSVSAVIRSFFFRIHRLLIIRRKGGSPFLSLTVPDGPRGVPGAVEIL